MARRSHSWAPRPQLDAASGSSQGFSDGQQRWCMKRADLAELQGQEGTLGTVSLPLDSLSWQRDRCPEQSRAGSRELSMPLLSWCRFVGSAQWAVAQFLLPPQLSTWPPGRP